RTGVSPRVATDRNKANYKRQFDLVGISFDWDREIDSSDPAYYRWTQWFFLMLYRRGLAYRETQWQWWCPICQTTLSNQEAQDGRRSPRPSGPDKEADPCLVLPNPRLRRRPAGRAAAHRVARAHQADADQLDRAQRGHGDRLPHRGGRPPAGLHHPAGH